MSKPSAARKKTPPKKPSRPLPKRGAKKNRLLGVVQVLKVSTYFLIAFLTLHALYLYAPLTKARNLLIGFSQQMGLKTETIVLQDVRMRGEIVGYLALKDCQVVQQQLQIDRCYKPKQAYAFHTSIHDITAALKIRPLQPILTTSPSALRQSLEELPWIESAVVSRRLPKTIVIALEERQAAAVWEDENQTLWLVDSSGHRITKQEGSLKSTLFVLHGLDAPAQLQNLLRLLAPHPRIQTWVIAATWTGGRRWVLTLKNGVEVHLPETETAAALARLSTEESQRQLFSRGFGKITIIPGAAWTFTPLQTRPKPSKIATP